MLYPGDRPPLLARLLHPGADVIESLNMVGNGPLTARREFVLRIDNKKSLHNFFLSRILSGMYTSRYNKFCNLSNPPNIFRIIVTERIMELDSKDLALIDALQQNASQRLEDLARMVRLAPSSVHDRLRRLERDAIIKRWTIDVDSPALGLGVLAFVGIRASRPCSELLEGLRSIACIEECHSVAGDLSLIVKVRVASTAALLELSERLHQIPGIEQTDTTIVLKTQIDRPISLKSKAAA